MWLGIYNTCDGVWSNRVGRNRDTDKEHGEDYVEEGFQMQRWI